MRLLALRKSDKPEKKYYAELETDKGRTKRVYFGDSNLKDYTTHSPLEREERKRLYIARHKVTEDWSDPTTAGFWSKHILWNRPTISASLLETKHKYHL